MHRRKGRTCKCTITAQPHMCTTIFSLEARCDQGNAELAEKETCLFSILSGKACAWGGSQECVASCCCAAHGTRLMRVHSRDTAHIRKALQRAQVQATRGEAGAATTWQSLYLKTMVQYVVSLPTTALSPRLLACVGRRGVRVFLPSRGWCKRCLPTCSPAKCKAA